MSRYDKPDEANERGPKGEGERQFLWFFCVLVFGLFLADLIDGYTNVKLGALFFLLWWVPLLILHELGHALVAGLFKWRVHEIQHRFSGRS